MAVTFPSFKSNLIARTFSRLNIGNGSLSSRPIIVAMSNISSNNSYCTSINSDIDTYLKKVIPIRAPLSVLEPMLHFVVAAPPTIAPSLCMGTCELVGGCRDNAMATAAALRLMHAAAYTHKHLLLTNEPRYKTAKTYGPNIELLIGDGIIPFGLELLVGLEDLTQSNSQRILRVIVEITRAIGSQGMVNGIHNECKYYDQDQANGKSSLIDVDWIDLVAKKKEGGLHACAGACGAILGGGNEKENAKLRKFGLYVGILQGILNGFVRKEKWSKKELYKLKNLALEELKGFDQEKIEDISSLISLFEIKDDENKLSHFLACGI